jgi:hypothetical protein
MSTIIIHIMLYIIYDDNQIALLSVCMKVRARRAAVIYDEHAGTKILLDDTTPGPTQPLLE